MAYRPSIDGLKHLQQMLMMKDRHVVYIDAQGFVIAHTDEERATIDLEVCELHHYLLDLDEPPVEPGYYIVTRNDKGPPEWAFEPIT